MYVGKYLRKVCQQQPVISWFLHIPFPSLEQFKGFPQHKQLLKALLKYNLVGFHLTEYLKYFQECCFLALGADVNSTFIKYKYKTNVVSIPIGIQPSSYTQKLHTPEVLQHLNSFQEIFKDIKLIIGVDRLYQIKGIPQKLLAFEYFLQENPDYVGKVVLCQLSGRITGRNENVDPNLKSQVHELVGRINAKFGSFEYLPIHYLDQNIDSFQLAALYRLADIGLITSLRDGINLVAYEYIAAQQAKHGVLILSEQAGCSKILKGGCLDVNPWDIKQISKALKQALEMQPPERELMYNIAQKQILKYTANKWAKNFIRNLKISSEKAVFRNIKQLQDEGKHSIESLAQKFQKENLNILVIDEILAIKAQKQILKLSRNETVHFILMTEKKLEESPLQSYEKENLTLCTEMGQNYKLKGRHEWYKLVADFDINWQNEVNTLFQSMQKKHPLSQIKTSNISVEWDLFNLDVEFGKEMQNDIVGVLNSSNITKQWQIEIIQSRYKIEVRQKQISFAKSLFKILAQIISQQQLSEVNVCVIGNFQERDDEEIGLLVNETLKESQFKTKREGEEDLENQQTFQTQEPEANVSGDFCIVGDENYNSQANYYFKSYDQFLSFMNKLE